MFKGDITIEFIKGNFTSLIIGNVWVGRVWTGPYKTAKAFIDHGYAKLKEDDGAAAEPEKIEPEKTETKTEPEKTGDDHLLGSSVQPAVFTKQNGKDLKKKKQVALGDVVQKAFEASKLSIADWNALAEADREKAIADVVAAEKLAA